MTRLIPPVVHGGTKSEGEKQIFEKLLADSATAGWVALHSYDLPEHVRRLKGEIDFVILVPGSGVLCLSIKDCASASRIQGMWYLGNLAGDASGPFKRAEEDKYSLLGKLEHYFGQWGERVPVSHAVMFTRVQSTQANWTKEAKEWAPHEEIYADELSRVGNQISRPILRCLNGFRQSFEAKHSIRLSENVPSVGTIDGIADLLRPDFEVFASPKQRAGLVDSELKRYLHEQYVSLDRAAEDERVYYRGRAGTGKTLLAIESARREVRNDPSKRVLVLCFNRLIGRHLAGELEPLGPKVIVRTLAKHMMASAGIRSVQDDPDFWTSLPRLALESLLIDRKEAPFDTLIIDEAQDILKLERTGRGNGALNRDVIDVIDLSLKGGWTNGRWLIFSDDYQGIYRSDSSDVPFDPVAHCIQEKAYAAKADPLRINCRNLPLVSSYAQILSNMRPGYSSVRRPDDRVLPALKYYSSIEEQCRLLTELITECVDPSQAPRNGFSGRSSYLPGEIVVLSPKATSPCFEALRSSQRFQITALGDEQGGKIRYGTIHAFKGLEAPVIIITDIESLSTEDSPEFNRSALLYVAITRSTERLAILAHKRVKDELQNFFASSI